MFPLKPQLPCSERLRLITLYLFYFLSAYFLVVSCKIFLFIGISGGLIAFLLSFLLVPESSQFGVHQIFILCSAFSNEIMSPFPYPKKRVVHFSLELLKSLLKETVSCGLEFDLIS